MRLWIAATAVGQASQRIVPMTRTVESFSLPYLTKCTISSHLISVDSNRWSPHLRGWVGNKKKVAYCDISTNSWVAIFVFGFGDTTMSTT
ncbi:hypothetical protein Gohar_021154, partial [Gossypium harknessii]|nr:hypothetical protein [Gossypium harknessii]